MPSKEIWRIRHGMSVGNGWHHGANITRPDTMADMIHAGWGMWCARRERDGACLRHDADHEAVCGIRTGVTPTSLRVRVPPTLHGTFSALFHAPPRHLGPRRHVLSLSSPPACGGESAAAFVLARVSLHTA